MNTTTPITDAEKTRIIKDLEDKKAGLEYNLDRLEDHPRAHVYTDEIDSLRDQIEEIEEEIWNAENLEIIES